MIGDERKQNIDAALRVINLFINNCCKLGGYCTGTEWILRVSTTGARYTEGKCCGCCSNPNLLGDILIAVIAGVGPVNRSREATAFELALNNVPVKHCQGVVLLVLVSYNFLYNCLSDALVINPLEIYKEPHSNFSYEETDKREDESDKETLAGYQGATTSQERESEGDQTRCQDGVGEDGELVPGGLEVEMFRHQESHPGRGEEDPEQHDEGVDSADTTPQHEVTTPTTHLARSCLLLP